MYLSPRGCGRPGGRGLMMSQLMMKPRLTLEMLKKAARTFAEVESAHQEPSLFGITDGKTVGTYVEQKFRTYLREQYDFEEGSAASGIDFPELGVDVKVTNTDQPQSSCPFQSARQKIYGLGYSLLIFIYDKTDDYQRSLSNLSIQHVIFVSKERTADFQTTTDASLRTQGTHLGLYRGSQAAR